MMEEDLLAILRHAAEDLPPARINFGSHPQGKGWPGIVLNVIDNLDTLTLNGPDGHWEGRVQVDCYGRDYDEAKLLARRVQTWLHGYHDDRFQGVFLLGTRDGHESDAPDRPFRISKDFATHWSAS
ncbi:tail completion protein gp17 [Falsirhodobacter halotolerans]|uniref:tail completion protein gp17 n=1 Tax=Falsirhodobacter halotolerans TaxID=1146892 RepID=UPI001FD3EC0F|nr:DUF3168 domain-containing protein [Falsirhodobacter halotolerans]MCJ8139356.1 DUF3168 domain-containing protein [Falsirhodobacter halotolerans]